MNPDKPAIETGTNANTVSENKTIRLLVFDDYPPAWNSTSEAVSFPVAWWLNPTKTVRPHRPKTHKQKLARKHQRQARKKNR